MKYGLLCYQPTGNIGDEIQSLAARQFLPAVDILIDRERMKDFQCSESVKMILNGWFMCEPNQWPPANSLLPLLTSLHISGEEAVKEAWFNNDNRQYLLRYGPVGARDTKTLALLRERDIPAYFSGCLTLTLKRNEQAARGDYICAVDVSPQVLAYMRAKTDRPVIPVTHWLPRHMRTEDTLVLAEMLLDLYQRAHCVITTRLHVSLPCLALETPVLLLNNPADNSRFAGLDVQVRHCTPSEYLQGNSNFDINSPGENPRDHLTLRKNLIEACFRFIGPEAEQAYANHAVRIFEGIFPFISIWEEHKGFERAFVELHRGKLGGLLMEIKKFFVKHNRSRRR